MRTITYTDEVSPPYIRAVREANTLAALRQAVADGAPLVADADADDTLEIYISPRQTATRLVCRTEPAERAMLLRLATAEADRDRYRRALAAIAGLPAVCLTDADTGEPRWSYGIDGPADIARAALEGRPWEGMDEAEEARHATD